MTRYSATDYLCDRVLAGAKLSSMAFRIQVNDVNIRLRMLLNNEMDAVWLAEPLATTARLAGNNVVIDSRDVNKRLGGDSCTQRPYGRCKTQKTTRCFHQGIQYGLRLAQC